MWCCSIVVLNWTGIVLAGRPPSMEKKKHEMVLPHSDINKRREIVDYRIYAWRFGVRVTGTDSSEYQLCSKNTAADSASTLRFFLSLVSGVKSSRQTRRMYILYYYK